MHKRLYKNGIECMIEATLVVGMEGVRQEATSNCNVDKRNELTRREMKLW